MGCHYEVTSTSGCGQCGYGWVNRRTIWRTSNYTSESSDSSSQSGWQDGGDVTPNLEPLSPTSGTPYVSQLFGSINVEENRASAHVAHTTTCGNQDKDLSAVRSSGQITSSQNGQSECMDSQSRMS